MKEVRLIKFIF